MTQATVLQEVRQMGFNNCMYGDTTTGTHHGSGTEDLGSDPPALSTVGGEAGVPLPLDSLHT